MIERKPLPALEGVYPAVLTPLTPDGEVDAAGLDKLLDYLLAGGVQGLWVLGSSGEFTALSSAQREQVTEAAVRRTAGQARVVVGVADNNLRNVMAGLDRAARLGADAAFVLLPFYFSVDPTEAVSYFQRIANDAPLPVVLYDNPASTRVRLPTRILAGIAEHPNIVAIKDSSGDFVRFQELAALAGSGWRLMQGDERLAGASVLLGGHGLVAALANIAPKLFVDLDQAGRSRDVERVIALQRQVHDLLSIFEIMSGPTDGSFFAGLKAALEIMSIAGRAVSAPFAPMPDQKMGQVREVLMQVGLV